MRGPLVWRRLPDMENGGAVVKPLVTRTSDGVEDDTFVKRLEG